MDQSFEWDEKKNSENQLKHGVAFEAAQYAFADPQRVIAKDLFHSQEEERYYCFGKVGAGYWRKGKQTYEEENHIHG